MINENFVFVGAIIATAGALSYFIDTIRGKIKPNKVSLLMWTLAPFLAFFAQLSKGVGIQSLTTFMVGFLTLIIFIASFVNKKAEWKIRRFDVICGLLSALGLILWFVTKEGNIAIAAGILSDGLASVPTIVKSFYYPETENPYGYGTGAVNSLLTLLTLKIWNFANISFLVYLIVVDVLIFTLVRYKIGKNISKKFHIF